MQDSEKTALIAMSGGVDSSVAAALLSRAGYDCAGCTMRLYENDLIGEDLLGTCCSLRDTEDARAVADQLGIPYHIFHHEAEFLERVIEPFVESYEQGRTPNPCIDCNRYLKFDSLYRRAEALGCRFLATGHYARIEMRDGQWYLLKGRDAAKDQSYVLFRLTEKQLAHTLFPLGDYTKPEIRQLAAECGFLNSRKKESQDICFVPDGDYAGMIERFRKRTFPPGEIVDTDGRVLGTHKGLIHYTVGQHKGLGLTDERRLYVKALDLARNTLVVSKNEGLYSRKLLLSDFHWITGAPPAGSFRCSAKIRYRHKEQRAEVEVLENARACVLFDEPQRAATPGQSAVLYDGEIVLGGGTIESAGDEAL